MANGAERREHRASGTQCAERAEDYREEADKLRSAILGDQPVDGTDEQGLPDPQIRQVWPF